MKGFISFLGILLLIIIALNNFWLFAGIALAIWGLFEWRINRKLEAKSKVPGIIVAIGLLIGAISLNVDNSEQAITASPSTEQTQANSQEIKQISDKPQQEEPKAATPKTNQNTQPQPSQNQNTNESEKSSQDAYITATVIEVVDGDTVKVNIDGKEETVRLLLVDTPETKDPNEPVQPFGPEASQFAKETLPARKEVKLEYDGPERDKYDRLLAYLWVGDKIFNQMLLEKGLARVAYVYDPPYTHYDAFVAAEKKAKDAKLGIWSIPGYVTEDGFHEEVAAAKEKPKQETVQQKPAQQTVYYKNCSAARAAGAAPLYRGDPGYRPALDRDGDGVACE